jgi:predicted PurR-regulated permease PerM
LNTTNSNLSNLSPKTKIDISWKSVVKVPVVALGCYLLYLLLPFAMLLFLSILLAVTFEPLILRMERTIGRKAAVGLITLLVLFVFVGVGFLVVPELIDQATALYQKLPDLVAQLTERFPAMRGFLNHLPKKVEAVDPSTVSPLLQHLAAMGAVAAGSLSSVVLIFAFMIYLLLDGSRVYAWLIAFFNDKTRSKIDATCAGVAPVISAYVLGQIVTSSLCAIFSYAILSWLNVPAALVLAVFAGVFDILPIVGFFVFTVPAALFALTVSTQAALLTVVLFGVYHLIETYLVSPLVYGNRLRVSGIVVLSTLIAGGTIGGIIGAIAILPIVASYPIVEKIWLKQILGRRVIKDHEEIAEGDEKSSGSDLT